MDLNRTPYMLYAQTEGESVLIDLATIPTELLIPIANSIPTEIWRRSERETFRADREAMKAVIEPKQLTLIFKR